MRNSFLFFCIAYIFSSCSSPMRFIKKNQLEELQISDTTLIRAINIYSKKYNANKSLIVVMTKDINNPRSVKYINHIFNVSNIYTHPISSYFSYKDKMVLVYSRKDGYLNPRKYPEDFLVQIKKLLHNNFNLIAEDNNTTFRFIDLGVLNHSTPWKILKGEIDSTKNYKFKRSEFLYNIKYFNYEDYDNLDDLKIIYPKDINDK